MKTRTRIGLGAGVLGLLVLVGVGTYWGTMALSAYSQGELDAAVEDTYQSGYDSGLKAGYDSGDKAGYARGQAAAQSRYDAGYAAAQTKDLNDIKAYLPLLLQAAYNRGTSSAPAPIYIAPSSVSCSSYAIGDWLRTNCYGW